MLSALILSLKSPRLLIRGARQLLTLRGPNGPRRGLALLDLGLIQDGAVLVESGVIQAVGTSRQLLSLGRSRDAAEIDATGRVVMPAFVDPSVSLVQARPSARNIDRLARFHENDDPTVFQEVLREGAHACASLSTQTLRKRAARVAAGMLRHGTGTVGSCAPYAFDEGTGMKILRAQQEQDESLQTVSILLLDSALLASTRGERAPTYTDYVCQDLIPKVRKRRLASGIDLAFDANLLPETHAARMLRCAEELGFLVAVHADLSARASAVPFAMKVQAASVSGFLNITPEEIRALAGTSTIGIFQPGATFQTGIGLQIRARAMLDAGVIPGLASGYHPELSPAYSMQMILLLASRLYRFTPEEAISAGTINNAHALRLERSVGSLETGKQADVLVLNVSDYRELAYYAGINVVDKVIKRGTVVYDSKSDSTPFSLDDTPASPVY